MITKCKELSTKLIHLWDLIEYHLSIARSDDCETPICDYKEKSGRSLEDQNPEALLQQPAEEGALMASYSVFVLEPGEQVGTHNLIE